MKSRTLRSKKYLHKNVLEAAKERIAWTFDSFPKIYLSFSAGKDSTVMMHLILEEARKRQRKVGVLFVDLEAQYKMTIDHAVLMYKEYADIIEPYWCCVSLNLRNAVSVYEPQWTCWDESAKQNWVRDMPDFPVKLASDFPFYRRNMEFEEFVPEFGKWYGQGELTACFVGIRTDESLNRWRTIAAHGTKFEGIRWTNWVGDTLYNIYPIYDWSVTDIWVYHGKTGLPYNAVYDMMHKAGLTPHQMRICQPYGDDQRKGLWLFHLIEPDTWHRVVARVSGANFGSLYAKEAGNILGNGKINKPDGHTWQSYVKVLLDSLPAQTKEHYEMKIAVFLKWWADNGYPQGIPDESDPKLESGKKVPSWRRICKTILKNDYWCKQLSFGQHVSGAYEKYKKVMKKRRALWGI